MSPEERAARKAWLAALSDPHDDEARLATSTTYNKLAPEERLSHAQWRNRVLGAVEKMLQTFDPDASPESAPGHWARCVGRTHRNGDAALNRPTIAEYGYFESIGRQLALLTQRQKVRVLTACLVAQSAECGIEAAVTEAEVGATARAYQLRLQVLSSPAPYDGLGLIAFAFPQEES